MDEEEIEVVEVVEAAEVMIDFSATARVLSCDYNS